MKKQKKLYITITIIVIVCISICVSIFILTKLNRKQELTCTYDHKNHKITQHLILENQEWNITINHTYTYDNMDDTVDKYDTYKKYLSILESDLPIKTNIVQEEYKVKYEISGKLSNFTESAIMPSEIEKIVNYTNIDEFKQYFKDAKYKCN